MELDSGLTQGLMGGEETCPLYGICPPALDGDWVRKFLTVSCQSVLGHQSAAARAQTTPRTLWCYCRELILDALCLKIPWDLVAGWGCGKVKQSGNLSIGISGTGILVNGKPLYQPPLISLMGNGL